MSWLWWPSVPSAGGTTVIETDLNATGTGTLTGVSGADKKSDAGMAGVGALAGATAIVLPTVLACTGLGTASWISGATKGSVLNAEGVGAFDAQIENGGTPTSVAGRKIISPGLVDQPAILT